jgi:hypothetical protein
MSNNLSAEEFMDSLTGFDEIGIQKVFGAKPIELGRKDRSGLMRGLYMIAQRREGLSEAEAKKAALGATLKEVGDFFPDAEDEPMPEDPATESGKDERLPEPTPKTSPASASQPASSPASTTP